MKIICQTCQSKYTVSDEKVQGKTVKIKCRKCGATILVNSSGATNGVAGVADPVSFGTGTGETPSVTYTVNVSDGDQRTMSLVEVVDAYNTSVITADTYVWADGMADWLPLGQVDAIVAALHGAAAAASQPPAAMDAPMAAPSFGNQMPEPAPVSTPAVAAAPRAAVRREVVRAGARDLFGAGGFGQEAQPVDRKSVV